MKAVLGYVHGGTVRAEFMASVLKVLAGPEASPLLGGVCEATSGSLVAAARNLLVEQFLEWDLQWLWSVDTDIVFSRKTLEQLLKVADSEARPIVSALSFVVIGRGSYSVDVVPSMYHAVCDSEGKRAFQPYLDMELREAVESGEPTRVDAVGASCLLVHRDVLLRIKKDEGPCWFNELILDGRHVGEDLSFCIRAERAGFPIYVDTNVQVGHVKPVVLGQVV